MQPQNLARVLPTLLLLQKNIETKLDILMKQFINDSTKNKISSGKVEVSKIFEWYQEDFYYKTLISRLSKQIF